MSCFVNSFVSFPSADGHPGAYVGESYGGGIVVYVDGTGAHGLIMSSANLSGSVTWRNGSNILVSGTSQAYGTGPSNTALIIAAQGAGAYAATVCDSSNNGGFSDWFLPSVVEMQYMNAYIAGGVAYYWTSSEVSSSNAYRINSWNNYASSTLKAQTGSVRGGRYF